jgi:hypothetical protein
MFKDIYIPIIGLILGILALKLPYQYNPFRLEYGIGDDTKWGQAGPKVFGWFFIVTCGLWLLGVVALLVLGMLADKS